MSYYFLFVPVGITSESARLFCLFPESLSFLVSFKRPLVGSYISCLFQLQITDLLQAYTLHHFFPLLVAATLTSIIPQQTLYGRGLSESLDQLIIDYSAALMVTASLWNTLFQMLLMCRQVV